MLRTGIGYIDSFFPGGYGLLSYSFGKKAHQELLELWVKIKPIVRMAPFMLQYELQRINYLGRNIFFCSQYNIARLWIVLRDSVT